MGFFDFLSAPAQDPTTQDQALYKKKKIPPTQELFQDDEITRLNQHNSEEMASRKGDTQEAAPKSQGVSPDDSRRLFAASESDLVKREQAAISEVRDIIGRSNFMGSPELSRVQDSLQKDAGRLTPEQIASDLDVILKKKGFSSAGHVVIDPGNLSRLAVLRNEFSRLAEDRQKFDAQGRPGGAPQVADQQTLELDASESLQRAQELEQKASRLGTLARDPVLAEARNLRAQSAALQQRAMEAKHQGEAPPAAPQAGPTSMTPAADYMRGLGIDKEQLTDRMHKAVKAVGIPEEQWEEGVDPKSGMLRVMGALDPQGQFATLLSGQIQAAKAQDAASAGAQPSDPEDARAAGRIDDTEKELGGREARLRLLYTELGKAQFMHTWPGIILYVLVGMITQNPAFAARLLGGIGNRDAVDAEIKGLQGDIRRLDQQLMYREKSRADMRTAAARRLQQKDDKNDTWRRQVGMAMLNHKLIIERNEKKGNPETAVMKKLQSSYQRATGMAAKYSGEMQNEFAPEDKRQQARANFNFYMKKAAALDMQLDEMGGEVLQEEAVEE
jgi:hypothetical protein